MFRYRDKGLFLSGILMNYWDKELFLPGNLCLRTGINCYFCLGSCLGSGIKSYFCLRSCLSIGINGYFCLGIKLTPMVLRPFPEGLLSCIQAIKKCWGKLCRLKTIKTFIYFIEIIYSQKCRRFLKSQPIS